MKKKKIRKKNNIKISDKDSKKLARIMVDLADLETGIDLTLEARGKIVEVVSGSIKRYLKERGKGGKM